MSGPLRRSRLRRALGLFAPVVLAATLASIAGAASGPPSALSGLGAWATAGSRLAFVATVGGRQGLWVERFGSGRPTRIGPAACAKEEQIDQLAAGPNGSWGCLERTVGNTEAYYSVDVISSSGVSRQVASAAARPARASRRSTPSPSSSATATSSATCTSPPTAWCS
jgi:hypothetical protein